MAKRSKKVNPVDEKQESTHPDDVGKIAFQLRLQRDVHQRLAKAATETGVSLNAVIEGILEACAQSLNFGRASKSENAVITQQAPGMLWFGRAPSYGYSDMEAVKRYEEWCDDPDDPPMEPPVADKLLEGGIIWFQLKLAGSPVILGD